MSLISLIENKYNSISSKPFFKTYKNLTLKLAIGTLTIPLTLTSIGTSSEAAIIYQNNFESGNFNGVYTESHDKGCSQDQSYINGSLFKVVTEKSRSGKYALKHNLKNCDERAELGISGGVLKSGQEYWIGWSYLFPKNFIKPAPGGYTYTIINQMFYQNSWIDQSAGKTLYECNRAGTSNGIYQTFGAPASEMTISPDGKSYHYKLKYYKGKDSQGRNIFGCKDFHIPATLDQWEDFVMNVKFSDKQNEGFVKLWKNGQLYMDQKVALLAPGTNVGPWKIGAYTGDPGNGERIVYTDELKVGNASSNYKEVSSPGAKLPTTTVASAAIAQVPEPSLVGGLMALGASLLLKKKQDFN